MASYPAAAYTPRVFNDSRSATPNQHAADHQAHDDEIVAMTLDLVAARGVLASLALRLAGIDTSIALKANIASPTFTGTVGGITASMVGLGSVDNTADTAKPVSAAQQTALNLKANIVSPTFTGTVGGITKAMVGLGSVDNTADTAKPVSTAQQTALDLKLTIASNLSDAPSAPSSRYNLHVPGLASAQVVSTSNIASLTGVATTIDGVTPVAGDIVLLTGQSTASQNGPWLVASGSWTRPLDYPAAGTVRGRTIEVNDGSVYAGTLWVLKTATAVTIDTTSTVWAEVGATRYALLSSVANVSHPARGFIGDGSSQTFVINHLLAQQYVGVTLWDTITKEQIHPKVVATDANNVTVGPVTDVWTSNQIAYWIGS